MRLCENVEMWKCENVEMWKCENVRMWKCGSVRMIETDERLRTTNSEPALFEATALRGF